MTASARMIIAHIITRKADLIILSASPILTTPNRPFNLPMISTASVALVLVVGAGVGPVVLTMSEEV